MDKIQAYQHIYQQYLDKTAFLWWLRHLTVEQSRQGIADILALEQRIQQSLDGLLTESEATWALCEPTSPRQDAGDTFAAAMLAFYSQDRERIEQVIQTTLTESRTRSGLISAAAWQSVDIIEPVLNAGIQDNLPEFIYLALARHSLLRQAPGDWFAEFLYTDDYARQSLLYGRAARLIGELKLHQYGDVLRQYLLLDQPYIQFWAAWSLCLLGRPEGLPLLQQFALIEDERQHLAIDLVCRVIPKNELRYLLQNLAKQAGSDRHIVQALAAAGDPFAMDWLIACTSQPKLARLAGQAISLITGWDLAQQQLTAEKPDNFSAEPNDDPADNNIATDPDAGLPWPDSAKLQALWQQQATNFTVGQRYLLGQAITVENLQQIINHGLQQQRHVAAMEWALLEPEQILINTRAKLV